MDITNKLTQSMNRLELKLKELNPSLLGKFQETKTEVSKLLQMYVKNFPTYTDHSIEHTMQVLDLAANILTDDEINFLNSDEIYILIMACILHDVGMCIPEEKISTIGNSKEIIEYRKVNPDLTTEQYLRDIHHILSRAFIMKEWKTLKIPSEKYAEAIGLVAQGHRKVDLNNFEQYDPQFFVRSNVRDFVCLPYLSCILRVADELDISNLRTPEILWKYYIPGNEQSRKEWEKHKNTILVNPKGAQVRIEARCRDHNMLAALEEQFEKIKRVISQCQKTIRSVQMIEGRKYNLTLSGIEPVLVFEDFDPKGIRYSFEVKNVINAFVGEDLYNDYTAALREAIQNAVDSCNYKKTIVKDSYTPQIIMEVADDFISIDDNGQGMDAFIIENYFGKLASSYYEQEFIKDKFEAIGQFGIGVFSYFLISDYIDVETKRAGKEGLKFRTDKDPNGYFHFFQDFTKEFDGTKLTLHLKPEFLGRFSLEGMSKFVRHTFPYIEIPITIKYYDKCIDILADEMKVDMNTTVLPHMYFSARNNVKKLKLISHSFDNERYKAFFSLVVPTDFRKTKATLAKVFDRNTFWSMNHLNDFSEITVTQKGVLINTYSAILGYSFGKLNIKKKFKVNLSRNEFRDEEDLDVILDEIGAKLIIKIFNEFYKNNDKASSIHAEFSMDFLSIYVTPYYLGSTKRNFKETRKVLLRNICFEVRDKARLLYMTVPEISKSFDKFVVFISQQEASKYSKKIKLPYVIVSISEYYSQVSFFEHLLEHAISYIPVDDDIRILLFDRSVTKESSRWMQWIEKNELNENALDFCYSTDGVLISNYWKGRIARSNSGYEYIWHLGIKINLGHRIFEELMRNKKDQVLERDERRLVLEILEMLREYQYDYFEATLEALLDRINMIISELSKLVEFEIGHLSPKDIGGISKN